MNLKELEKLMKLCHKYNVKSISVDGVSITVDTILPQKLKIDKSTMEQSEPSAPEYTDEDILMWSAGNI